MDDDPGVLWWRNYYQNFGRLCFVVGLALGLLISWAWSRFVGFEVFFVGMLFGSAGAYYARRYGKSYRFLDPQALGILIFWSLLMIFLVLPATLID